MRLVSVETSWPLLSYAALPLFKLKKVLCEMECSVYVCYGHLVHCVIQRQCFLIHFLSR